MLARIFITAASLLCLVTMASAFEGKYAGGTKGYRQSATITRAPNASFRVKLEVVTRGCFGGFEGLGRIKGTNLVARSGDKADPCEIVISRRPGGISVQERDCLMSHGAACEFSGQLKTSKAR